MDQKRSHSTFNAHACCAFRGRQKRRLTSDTQQGHGCRIWSNSSSKADESRRSLQPSRLLHGNVLEGGVANGVSHRLHHSVSSEIKKNQCQTGRPHRRRRCVCACVCGAGGSCQWMRARTRWNGAALVVSSCTTGRDGNLERSMGTDSKSCSTMREC